MSTEGDEPQIGDITSIRHSAVFCEGYGDFKLQSSDGVIFFFPKWLLSYCSPVFRDMFRLGEGESSGVGSRSVQAIATGVQKSMPQNQQLEEVSTPSQEYNTTSVSIHNNTNDTDTVDMIQVTEDALTLDLMLRHIDPNQRVAPLHEETISYLLEAARKYQLAKIFSWFESEAVKSIEYPEKVLSQPLDKKSLMSYNPLLVLSLATEYELHRLAQRAACALIGGSPNFLHKSVNIRLGIYQYVYGLREERIQWYHQRIGTIASKLFRGKPVHPTVCNCGNTRASWIHQLMETVLKNPRWKPFQDEVQNPNRACRPGCGEWGPQVKEDMMVWYHEAMQLESALPTLPF